MLTLKFEYPCLSFSQSGEDIIVNRLLRKVQKGWYVDVGAHHPTIFSNTYLLYTRGWRGVNIDASPGKMGKFKELRPRDINLEIAVSQNPGEISLSVFKKTAMNSASPELVAEYVKGGYTVTETVSVRALPLGDILRNYIPDSVEIGYLNIDVEGLDIDVLISYDWKRAGPRVISIEDLTFKSSIPEDSNIYAFLSKKGYALRAYTSTTLIFEMM